jgi:cytochrome P450
MWGMAQLARRVGPLWQVPGLGLIVSDATLARDILQRDDEFTKTGPGSFARALTAVLGPMALGNMDGNEHRQLRAAIAQVLAPARADMLVRCRIAAVQALQSELARGESVDLVSFIRGWSGRIAFDVVGIPPPAGAEEASSHDIVRLSERIAPVLGFREPSARRVRSARADSEQLATYFRDGYRRPAPSSSLVDSLLTIGLTWEQALGVVLIFVIGGTLTITAALPRIVALLVDSGLFNRLIDNPTGIARTIDEGLRYTAPLPGTVRIVRRAANVGGYKLTAGSRIVILTRNLARDPRLFPDPDRFDIARVHDPRARHLWFGAGPHFCSGFALAERELATVLEALVAQKRNLQIVKRRVAVGALLPCYSQLVVRFADRTA